MGDVCAMAPHLRCRGMAFLLTLTVNHECTVAVLTSTDKRTNKLWLVLKILYEAFRISWRMSLTSRQQLTSYLVTWIIGKFQSCLDDKNAIASLSWFHNWNFWRFSFLTFLLSKSTCVHALRVESISNWKNMQNEQQDTEKTRNFEPPTLVL